MHTSRRVVAVAAVPNLGDRGEAQLSVTNFTVFEAGYVGRVRKRPGHEPGVQLLLYNHFELLPRHCDGIEGSWAARRVRVSIPKDCLESDVGTADRFFVQFALGRAGDFDLAPAVRRLREG